MDRAATPPDYRLRPATLADVPVIAHHRAGMFADMGVLAAGDVPALTAASLAYLHATLPARIYRGWLVETAGGEVVGGIGVLSYAVPPGPDCLAGGEEAYVLNLYTEPAHRRRGLARALMSAVLAWCRERGVVRVALHASEEGRPLYESLGFAPTNEMRLGRRLNP